MLYLKIIQTYKVWNTYDIPVAAIDMYYIIPSIFVRRK